MADSLIAGCVQHEFGGGLDGSCVYVKLTPNGGESQNILDGFLAQQIQAQVSKQPRQVYEIGSNKYYVIDARPSGSGTIAHLIGPNTNDIFEQLANLANVCSKTDLTIGAYKSCACDGNGSATGAGGGATFKDGIMTSLQISATAQDYVITSNIGFMFFDVIKDTPREGTAPCYLGGNSGNRGNSGNSGNSGGGGAGGSGDNGGGGASDTGGDENPAGAEPNYEQTIDFDAD